MAGRAFQYRGYEIEIEPNGLEMIVTLIPRRPELPIFRRHTFRIYTLSEDAALTEARRRIDQLLLY
jgi:hypothetical protein